MKHMVIFAERFYNVLHWQTGGTNEDTWRYSFYPKSEYFTGLDLGHYFSNEISAKTDYFERLSEMGNRLKSEINKTCCKIEEDIEI